MTGMMAAGCISQDVICESDGNVFTPRAKRHGDGQAGSQDGTAGSAPGITGVGVSAPAPVIIIISSLFPSPPITRAFAGDYAGGTGRKAADGRGLANKEETMAFIAGSQLIRRSEPELDALLLAFNQALSRTEPFSAEWKDARLSVDNILSERRRRVNQPAPRPF